MAAEERAPRIEIQIQTSHGSPICPNDLGAEFVSAKHSVGPAEAPVSILVEPQESKAGNLFYSWDVSRIPLPDGFMTRLVVNGVSLVPGVVGESKNGNPMRVDKGTIMVGKVSYLVTAHIVKGRRPFWLKVHAHKSPARARKSS